MALNTSESQHSIDDLRRDIGIANTQVGRGHNSSAFGGEASIGQLDFDADLGAIIRNETLNLIFIRGPREKHIKSETLHPNLATLGFFFFRHGLVPAAEMMRQTDLHVVVVFFRGLADLWLLQELVEIKLWTSV